jgi:hypothetical protein
LTQFLSEINVSCHLEPGKNNHFLLLETLDENDWVENRLIDFVLVLDCVKKMQNEITK